MFYYRSFEIYFYFITLYGIEILSSDDQSIINRKYSNSKEQIKNKKTIKNVLIFNKFWQVASPYFTCDFSNECLSVKIIQPYCLNGYLEYSDRKYVNVALLIKSCRKKESFFIFWQWGSEKSDESEILRCRFKTYCHVPTIAILSSFQQRRWLNIEIYFNNFTLLKKISVKRKFHDKKKLPTLPVLKEKNFAHKTNVQRSLSSSFVKKTGKKIKPLIPPVQINDISLFTAVIKNFYFRKKKTLQRITKDTLFRKLRKKYTFQQSSQVIKNNKAHYGNTKSKTRSYSRYFTQNDLLSKVSYKPSNVSQFVIESQVESNETPAIRQKAIENSHVLPRKKRNSLVNEAQDLAILMQDENSRDKDKITEMIASDFASGLDIDKPQVSSYGNSRELQKKGPFGDLFKNVDGMVNDLKAENEREKSLGDVSESIASKQAHDEFHLKRLRNDIKKKEKQLALAEVKRDQAESDLLANTYDKKMEILAQRKTDAEDMIKKLSEQLHKLKEDYRVLRASTEVTDKGTKRKLHGLVVIDPMWGDWSPWSKCSVDCGEGGFSVRRRDCDTLPDVPCDGVNFDMRPCNTGLRCEAIWQEWGAWGPCSMTCGKGVRAKSRVCMTGDKEVTCKGESSRLEKCNLPPCEDQPSVSERSIESKSSGGGIAKAPLIVAPRSGEAIALKPYVWGVWGEWAACSKNCGEGRQVRVRACIDDSKTTLIRVMVRHCGDGSEAQSRSCMGACTAATYIGAVGSAAVLDYDSSHDGAVVVSQDNGQGPRVITKTEVEKNGEGDKIVPVIEASGVAVHTSEEDKDSQLKPSTIFFIVLLVIAVVLIIIAFCIWFWSRIDDLKFKKSREGSQPFYKDDLSNGTDPYGRGAAEPIYGLVKPIMKVEGQNASPSGAGKSEENLSKTPSKSSYFPKSGNKSETNKKNPKGGNFLFSRKNRKKKTTNIGEDIYDTGGGKAVSPSSSSSATSSSSSSDSDKDHPDDNAEKQHLLSKTRFQQEFSPEKKKIVIPRKSHSNQKDKGKRKHTDDDLSKSSQKSSLIESSQRGISSLKRDGKDSKTFIEKEDDCSLEKSKVDKCCQITIFLEDKGLHSTNSKEKECSASLKANGVLETSSKGDEKLQKFSYTKLKDNDTRARLLNWDRSKAMKNNLHGARITSETTSVTRLRHNDSRTGFSLLNTTGQMQSRESAKDYEQSGFSRVHRICEQPSDPIITQRIQSAAYPSPDQLYSHSRDIPYTESEQVEKNGAKISKNSPTLPELFPEYTEDLLECQLPHSYDLRHKSQQSIRTTAALNDHLSISPQKSTRLAHFSQSNFHKFGLSELNLGKKTSQFYHMPQQSAKISHLMGATSNKQIPLSELAVHELDDRAQFYELEESSQLTQNDLDDKAQFYEPVKLLQSTQEELEDMAQFYEPSQLLKLAPNNHEPVQLSKLALNNHEPVQLSKIALNNHEPVQLSKLALNNHEPVQLSKLALNNHEPVHLSKLALNNHEPVHLSKLALNNHEPVQLSKLALNNHEPVQLSKLAPNNLEAKNTESQETLLFLPLKKAISLALPENSVTRTRKLHSTIESSSLRHGLLVDDSESDAQFYSINNSIVNLRDVSQDMSIYMDALDDNLPSKNAAEKSYEEKKESVLRLMQGFSGKHMAPRGSDQSQSSSLSMHTSGGGSIMATDNTMAWSAGRTSSWTTGSETIKVHQSVSGNANANKNMDLQSESVCVNNKKMSLLKTVCIGQSRVKIYGKGDFYSCNPVCAHTCCMACHHGPCVTKQHHCSSLCSNTFTTRHVCSTCRHRCAHRYGPSSSLCFHDAEWCHAPSSIMRATGLGHDPCRYQKCVRFSESTILETDASQSKTSHDVCLHSNIFDTSSASSENLELQMKKMLNLQIQKFMDSTKWVVTKDPNDIHIDWTKGNGRHQLCLGLDKNKYDFSFAVPHCSATSTFSTQSQAWSPKKVSPKVCDSFKQINLSPHHVISNNNILIDLSDTQPGSQWDLYESKKTPYSSMAIKKKTSLKSLETSNVKISNSKKILQFSKDFQKADKSKDLGAILDEQYFALSEQSLYHALKGLELYKHIDASNELDDSFVTALEEQQCSDKYSKEHSGGNKDCCGPFLTLPEQNSSVERMLAKYGCTNNPNEVPPRTVWSYTKILGSQSDSSSESDEKSTDEPFLQTIYKFDVQKNSKDPSPTLEQPSCSIKPSDKKDDHNKKIFHFRQVLPKNKKTQKKPLCELNDQKAKRSCKGSPDSFFSMFSDGPLEDWLMKSPPPLTQEATILEIDNCSFYTVESLPNSPTLIKDEEVEYLQKYGRNSVERKPKTCQFTTKESQMNEHEETSIHKPSNLCLQELSEYFIHTKSRSDESVWHKISMDNLTRSTSDTSADKLLFRSPAGKRRTLDCLDTIPPIISANCHSEHVDAKKEQLYRKQQCQTDKKEDERRLLDQGMYRKMIFESNSSSKSEQSYSDSERSSKCDPIDKMSKGQTYRVWLNHPEKKKSKKQSTLLEERCSVDVQTTEEYESKFRKYHSRRQDSDDIKPGTSSNKICLDEIKPENICLQKVSPDDCKSEKCLHRESLDEEKPEKSYSKKRYSNEVELERSHKRPSTEVEKEKSHSQKRFSVEVELERLYSNIISSDDTEPQKSHRPSMEVEPQKLYLYKRFSNEVEPERLLLHKRCLDEVKIERSYAHKICSDDVEPEMSQSYKRTSTELEPEKSNRQKQSSYEITLEKSHSHKRFSCEVEPDRSYSIIKCLDDIEPERSHKRPSTEVEPGKSYLHKRYSDEVEPEKSCLHKRSSDIRPERYSHKRYSDEVKPEKSCFLKASSDETKQEKSIMYKGSLDEVKPGKLYSLKKSSDQARQERSSLQSQYRSSGECKEERSSVPKTEPYECNEKISNNLLDKCEEEQLCGNVRRLKDDCIQECSSSQKSSSDEFQPARDFSIRTLDICKSKKSYSLKKASDELKLGKQSLNDSGQNKQFLLQTLVTRYQQAKTRSEKIDSLTCRKLLEKCSFKEVKLKADSEAKYNRTETLQVGCFPNRKSNDKKLSLDQVENISPKRKCNEGALNITCFSKTCSPILVTDDDTISFKSLDPLLVKHGKDWSQNKHEETTGGYCSTSDSTFHKPSPGDEPKFRYTPLAYTFTDTTWVTSDISEENMSNKLMALASFEQLDNTSCYDDKCSSHSVSSCRSCVSGTTPCSSCESGTVPKWHILPEKESPLHESYLQCFSAKDFNSHFDTGFLGTFHTPDSSGGVLHKFNAKSPGVCVKNSCNLHHELTLSSAMDSDNSYVLRSETSEQAWITSYLDDCTPDKQLVSTSAPASLTFLSINSDVPPFVSSNKVKGQNYSSDDENEEFFSLSCQTTVAHNSFITQGNKTQLPQVHRFNVTSQECHKVVSSSQKETFYSLEDTADKTQVKKEQASNGLGNVKDEVKISTEDLEVGNILTDSKDEKKLSMLLEENIFDLNLLDREDEEVANLGCSVPFCGLQSSQASYHHKTSLSRAQNWPLTRLSTRTGKAWASKRKKTEIKAKNRRPLPSARFYNSETQINEVQSKKNFRLKFDETFLIGNENFPSCQNGNKENFPSCQNGNEENFPSCQNGNEENFPSCQVGNKENFPSCQVGNKENFPSCQVEAYFPNSQCDKNFPSFQADKNVPSYEDKENFMMAAMVRKEKSSNIASYSSPKIFKPEPNNIYEESLFKKSKKNVSQQQKSFLATPFFWLRKDLQSEDISEEDSDLLYYPSTGENTLSDVSTDIFEKTFSTSFNAQSNEKRASRLNMLPKEMTGEAAENLLSLDTSKEHVFYSQSYGFDWQPEMSKTLNNEGGTKVEMYQQERFKHLEVQYSSTVCYQKPSEVCCIDYQESRMLVNGGPPSFSQNFAAGRTPEHKAVPYTKDFRQVQDKLQ